MHCTECFRCLEQLEKVRSASPFLMSLSAPSTCRFLDVLLVINRFLHSS